MAEDYFWTSREQAAERLIESVVLYDDEPVYIRDIEAHEDGIPRGYLQICAEGAKSNPTRKMLNSPKFKRFRELPNLGWMNSAGNKEVGAIFLSRRAAVTRTHGLCQGNVACASFVNNGDNLIIIEGAYNFRTFMFDKGFVDAHHNRFPSLDGILTNIKENTSIAYSRRFCVSRDATGIRWLHRNTDRVGIFTGVDTLNLLSKFAFLREEIMEDPAFTLNTIREF